MEELECGQRGITITAGHCWWVPLTPNSGARAGFEHTGTHQGIGKEMGGKMELTDHRSWKTLRSFRVELDLRPYGVDGERVWAEGSLRADLAVGEDLLGHYSPRVQRSVIAQLQSILPSISEFRSNVDKVVYVLSNRGEVNITHVAFSEGYCEFLRVSFISN